MAVFFVPRGTIFFPLKFSYIPLEYRNEKISYIPLEYRNEKISYMSYIRILSYIL